MKKILYSPGFGAGWSSWMSGIPQKFACEYQPIIEALERDEQLDANHPAIKQFEKDCLEKFGQNYVCIIGCKDLEIEEVSDDTVVRINEYDGSESVEIGYNGYF